MLESIPLEKLDLKHINPESIHSRIQEVEQMMLLYNCAVKEVKTKLEILNDEFQIKKQRNPIEHMKYRIKSVEGIARKLEKKGIPLSVKGAMAELNDIAGIRVICSFIDDIYYVAEILKNQDDLKLISEKDYIKNPKPNGYRSYHMVLEVPIFFSNGAMPARVEVQIRTIAMDFWASLEHKLYYKKDRQDAPEDIYYRLQQCADVISKTDEEMKLIRHLVEQLG